MYFTKFPRLVYDFDLGASVDYKVITDITNNIRFRKQILENVFLYEQYEIKEGETPEIISEKIYGTPYYHWVIMLSNQRYDYVNDFPLTQVELDKFIEEKYGDKKELPHHYEKNGFIVEGTNILSIRSTNISGGGVGNVDIGELLQSVNNGYLARVDEIIAPTNDNLTSQIRVSLREGKFLKDELLKIRNETTFVTADQVSVPIELTEVSNFEYEFELNESKRNIKIISPRYLEQIFREFEEILG